MEDLNKIKNNIKEFRTWWEDPLEKRNEINLDKNFNLSNNEIIHISYQDIFGKSDWKYVEKNNCFDDRNIVEEQERAIRNAKEKKYDENIEDNFYDYLARTSKEIKKESEISKN